MTATKYVTTKNTNYPQLMIDSDVIKRRNAKTKGFIYFLVFVLPLLSLTILFLSHLFSAERSVFEASEINYNLLQNWELRFGTFLRKYYMENTYDYLMLPGEDPRDSDGENLNESLKYPWSKLPNPPKPSKEQCENIPDGLKFDCYPRGEATEQTCSDRGCCFLKSTTGSPYCFFPKGFNSYKYTNITRTEKGVTALLAAQFRSPYPNDITNLKMDFIFLTNDILYINVSDVNKQRFSFPFPDEPIQMYAPNDPVYEVVIDESKIGFKIVRKSNKRIIFDSQDIGGFIYSDQFIQVSSVLPTQYIYGLGERRNNFLLDTNWKTISLFTHDSEPRDNINLYGFHPFYLSLEGDGMAHGVYIKNHYPMDVVLQPGPGVTFRMIGGNLQMAVMLGPSSIEVVEQYTSLIGRPIMPPYWSLGFHLCRYNYTNMDHLYTVWNRTRAAGIPFDTQWTDIDYMDKYNDFTLNEKRFKGLPDFVKQVHDVGMHYVLIVDPGISAGEKPGTYPPYDEGIKENIFIMDSNGKKPFVGKVWNPESTVFPDFTHPKVVQYWLTQFKNFHDKIPIDGAWIDMNEPSNFLDGTAKGCPNNLLENPPYVPAIVGSSLKTRTICMSATQHFGKHYDLHNLFGTLETIITSFAMAQLRESRPFVISRSTAPGQGKFGGHWTGDISSTWDDMRHSISDMMSFSMFGIPLVGADICGFNGNTTETLCQRWSQLGAFYPFSRNHNEDNAVDQDPVAMGEGVVDSAKKALQARYALLPYLYTLFWLANTKGTPLIQPLFMQFPTETATYNISTQFMWGNSMLFAPVLEEGVTYVKAYLPKAVWYNCHTSERIESSGQFYATSAPLDIIPMFHRGGTVIPLQVPGTTTTESRKNPFYIFVAMNESMHAFGQLYWDDGESIGQEFNLIEWVSCPGKLESKVIFRKYQVNMPLISIFIYAVPTVKKVQIGTTDVPFNYNATTKVLGINLEKNPIDLGKDFTVSWS